MVRREGETCWEDEAREGGARGGGVAKEERGACGSFLLVKGVEGREGPLDWITGQVEGSTNEEAEVLS